MKSPLPALWIAACCVFLPAFSVPPRTAVRDQSSVAIEITTTVNADGSGTFAIRVVLYKDLLALLRSLPDFSTADLCDRIMREVGEFPETAETERDGILTCTASIPFTDLEGLKAATEQVFDSGSFARLEIAGGRFYYDLAAALDSPAPWEAELGFGVTAWWIVDVPGEVVDTNADKAGSGTVSWDLTTLNGAAHMQVESDLGSSGTDPVQLAAGAFLLLGFCCVVLLGAGVAGFFLLRKT
jgi:hypothetical protein